MRGTVPPKNIHLSAVLLLLFLTQNVVKRPKIYVQCPEDETCDISENLFFAREPNYEITPQPTNKAVIKISKHRPIPDFFC
jgi:hypothetical protein